MKTAILIDGAFLRKKFWSAFRNEISSEKTEEFVKRILKLSGLEESQFRAYFYDCRPCDKSTSLPVSKKNYSFQKTRQFKEGNELLDKISKLDYFAVREGQISFSGWALKKDQYNKPSHTDDSFTPCLSQKGVDMKIGLDVAWISYEKTFDRIILVTADSDFIPAIKVARRSGIFIHLFTLNHGIIDSLYKNADVTRTESLKDIFK